MRHTCYNIYSNSVRDKFSTQFDYLCFKLKSAKNCNNQVLYQKCLDSSVMSNISRSDDMILTAFCTVIGSCRIQDLFYLFCSYIVASGIIEHITRKICSMKESIENQQNLLLPLLAMLGFLTKITEICPKGKNSFKCHK